MKMKKKNVHIIKINLLKQGSNEEYMDDLTFRPKVSQKIEIIFYIKFFQSHRCDFRK